jgi:NAD(P)-dependent dehydrogenase (short-subunit alcohol dehydrogenase family)
LPFWSKKGSCIVHDGKIVLVTGAGNGIGQSTAVAFGKAGATVILVDRDESGLQQTQALLPAGAHLSRVMDVTSEDDWRALATTVREQFGRLDSAANIAGIVGSPAPTADQDTEEFRRVVDINVTGIFLAMKHELPFMLQAGRGSIVNATSYVSVVAFAQVSSYVASKHAVAGLTKATALEYARQGIRVNAIGPGPIDAGMLKIFFASNPAAKEALAESVPMGRLGTSEEIAQAVLWLCSDQASYCTGMVLFADGGALIQ